MQARWAKERDLGNKESKIPIVRVQSEVARLRLGPFLFSLFRIKSLWRRYRGYGGQSGAVLTTCSSSSYSSSSSTAHVYHYTAAT